MNIYEAMDYINSFSKQGKPVENLIRFSRLMNALNSPYKHSRFVHVSGTNGKGSTVRMIANSLIKAGYKTGEFTSPFIKIYNDRIKINGKNISDAELCGIVSQIKPIIDNLYDEYSQFEITTTAAFIYFAVMKCDIVVLETGLGGLLDCTNIIESPEVSVITSISQDHTAVLGDTYELIARQKAGIIKPGRPAVLSCGQNKDAYNVIYSTALFNNSKLYTPNTELLSVEKCDHTGSKFTYKLMPYQTAMLGKHQIENALTAIETCRVLKKNGFTKLNYVSVYEGIKTAAMPSRCQVLRTDKPFIIIDGAHNPGGMKALADFIRNIPKTPKIMVCGMAEDKDWQTAAGFITRYIDYGICIDGFMPKTVFAPKLAAMFEKAETSGLRECVQRAVFMAGEHGMVVIAGSLYLASALRQQME